MHPLQEDPEIVNYAGDAYLKIEFFFKIKNKIVIRNEIYHNKYASTAGNYYMKNRKPNRLKNYDYSRAGSYFITICTHNRVNYFGDIKDGIMELNDFGEIAHELWSGLTKTFDNILLDIFVIMPNHIHGIIGITEDYLVRDAYSKIENIRFNKELNSESEKQSNLTNMRPLQKNTDIVNPAGDTYPEIDNYRIDNAKNHGLEQRLNSTNMRPLQDTDRSKMYLSKIIQIYKSKVTRKVNNKRRIKKVQEIKLWQRSFYDRIIRNEKEFYNIQQYIFENPIRWAFDKENSNILISDTEYYKKIFNRL